MPEVPFDFLANSTISQKTTKTKSRRPKKIHPTRNNIPNRSLFIRLSPHTVIIHGSYLSTLLNAYLRHPTQVYLFVLE